MGKTDLFTQFYPTGFTQWVKLTVPILPLPPKHNTDSRLSHDTEEITAVIQQIGRVSSHQTHSIKALKLNEVLSFKEVTAI